MFTPPQYYFGFGNGPAQKQSQTGFRPIAPDIFPSGAPKVAPVSAVQPISNLIAIPNK